MDHYKHERGALKLKATKATTVSNRDSKPTTSRRVRGNEDRPISSKMYKPKHQRQFELQEGRIVSMETTIQGFETKFIECVSVGDTLGVQHPTSMEFEERIVTSVLSQRTLTIDSGFSSSIVSTTAFFIRKDSKDLGKGEQLDTADEELAKRVAAKAAERQGTTLQIRDRTGMWSYKIRTEKLDREYTAEELLDMRIKQQGRDKYC